MPNFKVVSTLWQICIVGLENIAAKRRLCTRANYECCIEVKSCGDSSRQLLTSATKCTVDVQLFRTKQNKDCSAVKRHWFLSTVIPLRFKNWFVHMWRLHKPGSNTFVTNMLLLVQYPGQRKTLFHGGIRLSKAVHSVTYMSPCWQIFTRHGYMLYNMKPQQDVRLVPKLERKCKAHLASGPL